MKAGQVRGMTEDQLSDELIKLKKGSSTCAPGGVGPAREHGASAQIKRDIARIQTIARRKPAREGVKEPRPMPKKFCKGRGERQERQDRGGPRRAALHASVAAEAVRRSKNYHAHDEKNEFKGG